MTRSSLNEPTASTKAKQVAPPVKDRAPLPLPGPPAAAKRLAEKNKANQERIAVPLVRRSLGNHDMLSDVESPPEGATPTSGGRMLQGSQKTDYRV